MDQSPYPISPLVGPLAITKTTGHNLDLSSTEAGDSSLLNGSIVSAGGASFAKDVYCGKRIYSFRTETEVETNGICTAGEMRHRIAANGTANSYGLYGINRPTIATGITNGATADLAGAFVDCLRNFDSGASSDGGTTGRIIGIRSAFGHYDTLAPQAPQTTTVFGLWLSPMAKTGTITDLYCLYIDTIGTGGAVTNKNGIYQAASDCPNTLLSSLTVFNASGILSRQAGPPASGPDGIALIGGSTGSNSYSIALSPLALTASRTASFPDASIVVSGSASALTSGRVPYATTGGLLLDSANLAFDGTNFAHAGTGTFGTGTGAVALNGAVTAASTVKVTTRAGIGGNPSTACALALAAPSDISGATQRGVLLNNFIFTSAATSQAIGFSSSIQSAAAAFTCTEMDGFLAGAHVLGAGSTITNAIGFRGARQTVGTSNVGYLYGTNSITAGNWCIYNQTVDPNYLGTGATLINTTTDDTIHKFQVAGKSRAAGFNPGVTSTATAAGTTTLTIASNQNQTFTGSTTQTINFPAANAAGAGFSVVFTINNQSSGTVTPTRAGSDTFQGGGTTDPVLAGASTTYASDGVSVWLKV